MQEGGDILTKTDFLAQNQGSSLAAWERAAIDAAKTGGTMPWLLVEVPLTPAGGHTGSVFVASDVFAVGEPGDVLRMPLTPKAAQEIANLNGYLLPTRKIAQDIWRAAKAQGVTLEPRPAPSFGQANKGADLAQYASHNAVIDAQLASAPASQVPLVSGHKKDVVISRGMKPGKVVIYGWFNPDGSRIQPLSDVHGDFYVDYSHGIRFVAPDMIVDGQVYRLEDVLKDPTLSALVSDEGPLTTVRYPAPGGSSPPAPSGGGISSWVAMLGLVSPPLVWMIVQFEAKKAQGVSA